MQANLQYDGVPTTSCVLKSATQSALSVYFSCDQGAFMGTCLSARAAIHFSSLVAKALPVNTQGYNRRWALSCTRH